MWAGSARGMAQPLRFTQLGGCCPGPHAVGSMPQVCKPAPYVITVVVAMTAAVASRATTWRWFSGGSAGEPTASTHRRTVLPAAMRALTWIWPVRTRPSGAVHRARIREEPRTPSAAVGAGAACSTVAGTWRQERPACR